MPGINPNLGLPNPIPARQEIPKSAMKKSGKPPRKIDFPESVIKADEAVSEKKQPISEKSITKGGKGLTSEKLDEILKRDEENPVMKDSRKEAKEWAALLHKHEHLDELTLDELKQIKGQLVDPDAFYVMKHKHRKDDLLLLMRNEVNDKLYEKTEPGMVIPLNEYDVYYSDVAVCATVRSPGFGDKVMIRKRVEGIDVMEVGEAYMIKTNIIYVDTKSKNDLEEMPNYLVFNIKRYHPKA